MASMILPIATAYRRARDTLASSSLSIAPASARSGLVTRVDFIDRGTCRYPCDSSGARAFTRRIREDSEEGLPG
jgi:hypothetical protein